MSARSYSSRSLVATIPPSPAETGLPPRARPRRLEPPKCAGIPLLPPPAETGPRALVQPPRVASDVADGRVDELTPRSQARREERARQRRVAVAGGEHVLAPDELPELLLELPRQTL